MKPATEQKPATPCKLCGRDGTIEGRGRVKDKELITALTEALTAVTRNLDETLIVVSRAVDQCARNATAMETPSRQALEAAHAALALAE